MNRRLLYRLLKIAPKTNQKKIKNLIEKYEKFEQEICRKGNMNWLYVFVH